MSVLDGLVEECSKSLLHDAGDCNGGDGHRGNGDGLDGDGGDGDGGGEDDD